MLFVRYYALELCSASLEKLYLKDGDPKKYCGPIIPDEDMLLQLAMGLQYIHENNLVHRDLKPENVLIWVDKTQDDNQLVQVIMKWADFGLSKGTNERGSFSMSGIRGTNIWFAPEILAMFKSDKNAEIAKLPRGTVKSDVFSEGLTFSYILLQGEHPYGSPTSIVHNISQNNAVNLKS